MPERRVVDLFNISSRFLRSVHLERDFNDPSVLSGYVPTAFVKQCLGRLTSGLKSGSGQRAWRITGDYGSGKSSLALFLAHWFNGNPEGIPADLRRSIDLRQFGVQPPNFVPVLVTCARQPLRHSIITALVSTVSATYGRRTWPNALRDLKRYSKKDTIWSDDQVLDVMLRVNASLISDGKSKGLLFIIDELGKYLEFAALQPQQEDVFLLQRLAESAVRSGNQPLFLVCLLHQGFTAYADQLSKTEQREWEKIAGRFEEIVFDQPLEQIANLIASALNLKVNRIPRTQSIQIRKAMQKTLELRWLGNSASRKLIELSTQLYPLHPTLLPVLLRVFRKFGQNERSLFGFLLSQEPFGLQTFSDQAISQADFYRLHNFYDYIRANLDHRLTLQSYRTHWSFIDSLIESFATEDELQIKILKTIGILNLLNDGDILPSEDIVICALAEDGERRKVQAAINDLRIGKKVIYDRGRARGLCLWPHTSVDIEEAYNNARKAVEAPQCVADYVSGFLQARPVIARCHYIKTGNLRFYNVLYSRVDDLSTILKNNPGNSDGTIIVPLCETVSERALAIQVAKDAALEEHKNILIAVPQPLSNLSHLVQEAQLWEWVITNTLELNADKFAREEVSRQQEASRWQLEKRIQHFIGFGRLADSTSLEWFYLGHSLVIKNGRHLLSELSRIFDETYHLAPCIHNELINRRTLSSSAAAARMRLIERMFTKANIPLLGMNPDKKPPEMSMYLSVLLNTGLHRKVGNEWQISEPHHKADKQCKILPSLHCIRNLIKQKADARINILSLFKELRKPPYGIRDGLIPLLFTVYAIVHEKDLAFYKDGTFLRELTSEAMLVLTKAPERFEVQYCRIAGVRSELFRKLLTVLEMQPSQGKRFELLGVVKKLCVFVAHLPQYVHNTKFLSSRALAIREAVLNARDPVKLLFSDLPIACGFKPITEHSTSPKEIQLFVQALKSGLDDLRVAFPELQDRLRKELRAAFDLPGSFHDFREGLANRAEQLVLCVTESKLRAFCFRIMDNNLPENEWIESVGSYLALKPPAKWHDA
ncbi:MAG: hypothetical protein JW902_18160, partial [Syntrophaceae bacterium]|nr:hypothetical protein [Syntrophaceae bacterium]